MIGDGMFDINDDMASSTPAFLGDDDRLTRMITAQLALQHANGVDPLSMTLDERVHYIKDMMLALQDELSETLREVSWKPWTTGASFINRDKAFGELRDAWQFLTNLMLAVTQLQPGELARELESALNKKHTVNHARVRDGYDGVSTKCPHCGGALDEPGVEITQVRTSTGHVQRYCPLCNEMLPIRFTPDIRRAVSEIIERATVAYE